MGGEVVSTNVQAYDATQKEVSGTFMYVIPGHSRSGQGPGHETKGKKFGLRHVQLGPSLGLVIAVPSALLPVRSHPLPRI